MRYFCEFCGIEIVHDVFTLQIGFSSKDACGKCAGECCRKCDWFPKRDGQILIKTKKGLYCKICEPTWNCENCCSLLHKKQFCKLHKDISIKLKYNRDLKFK